MAYSLLGRMISQLPIARGKSLQFRPVQRTLEEIGPNGARIIVGRKY
jgi:hypothetical protein